MGTMNVKRMEGGDFFLEREICCTVCTDGYDVAKY